MDYYTILAQKTLLEKGIAGKKINTVRLHEKKLYIGFSDETALKLACIPDMPYLLIIQRRFIPVRKSRNWLISRFSDKSVVNLSLTPGDRVLTFCLDSGARLVFEMTGRHANIVLVDSEGIIAGEVRKVTSRQSRYREIRTGIQYIPPPAREFPDLLWAPLPLLKRKLKDTDTDISKALAALLCSGSRLFAREALARTELDPALPAADLNEQDTFRLLKTVAEMAGNIEKGGDGGTVLCGSDGIPRDVFPLRMVSAEQDDKYYGTLNDALLKYSREREIALERRNNKNIITSALSREEKSLRITIKKIERERGKKSEPDILERKGNTILANLNLIHKGMTSVNMPDPYGGGEVYIELDPTCDGPSNAKRCFSRGRKLRVAAKLAEKRIANIEKRIDEIQEERERLETIDDFGELKKIAAEYARKTASRRDSDPDRSFPRRFMSASGLEIIVGRNNRENDELVRWARKNDTWMHAQGVGGSHVIVRSPGKNQRPDHKSIEHAASIAAYYSKAKTSAVVPVVSTLVKYVVKRKGQGPGQVTYTREKVIFTEPGLSG